MKKIIFTLCLCFMSMTLSSQITETVSIPDNSIKIRAIGNYSKVECGNSIYTDRVGYPSIPSVIKSYAIPIDAYDVRLSSSIVAKIDGNALDVPALEQNDPNPFTQTTVVRYTLPESVKSAFLYIYDLNGTQIDQKTLQDWGKSSVTLEAGSLAPSKVFDTKRMIITN